MAYDVLVDEQPREFLSELDDKSYRICRKNLLKVAESPYPGRGAGDKKKLTVRGEEIYRLHIGRTYTAFYDIAESDGEVLVKEIVDIDTAHKRYGTGRQ